MRPAQVDWRRPFCCIRERAKKEKEGGEVEVPLVNCRPEDFAGACLYAALPGATLCERHLRGDVLAVLDRRGWPRLRMAGGKAVAGDDAWRQWLREATGEELLAVLRMLGETEAIRRSA
jgi:hypothetical protein